MERLVFNAIMAQVRQATLNGRDYLVAPLTLIVPGVLNGSKGKLYYPEEEVIKNPDVWNGMPMVVGHPTLNGQPISARNPDVYGTQWIGMVLNAKAKKGKLVGEGWFDVETTRRVDVRILKALQAHTPLELSTGLYTTNEAADDGAVWPGPMGPRPYDYIARNYQPDHLAILPDQIGACSIADGCGVLVANQSIKWQKWQPMTTTTTTTATNSSLVANLKMSMSLGEWEEAVRSAFREAHPYKPAMSGMSDMSEMDCWVVAIFDDHLIYREGGELYRQDYSVDKANKITLMPTMTEVQKQTKYVPVSTSTTMNSTWRPDMKLTDAERAQLVTDLTTNCDCWKAKGDREVLLNFADEKLIQLKEHANREQQMVAVANAAVKGVPDGTGNVFRVNPQTGEWERGVITKTVETPKDDTTQNTQGGQGNQGHTQNGHNHNGNGHGNNGSGHGSGQGYNQNNGYTQNNNQDAPRQAKTVEEYINMAPAHIRSQVENTLGVAREVEQREKSTIIAQLLVNVGDSEKQVQFERLQRRSVEDLRNDLALIPKPHRDEPRPTQKNIQELQANRGYGSYGDEEDMLQVPTINWQKVDVNGKPTQNGQANSANNGAATERARAVQSGEVPVSQLSDDEVLRTLPPHMRAAVQNAISIESQERRKLIQAITTNGSLDEEQERLLTQSLNNKPLQELRLLASLTAKKEPARPNYFGGSTPAPTANARPNDAHEDVLLPPQMNWTEVRNQK